MSTPRRHPRQRPHRRDLRLPAGPDRRPAKDSNRLGNPDESVLRVGTRLRSKLALPRRRNRFSTASTHNRLVAFRSPTRRNLGNRLNLWTETRGNLRTGPTRLLYVYSVPPVA